MHKYRQYDLKRLNEPRSWRFCPWFQHSFKTGAQCKLGAILPKTIKYQRRWNIIIFAISGSIWLCSCRCCLCTSANFSLIKGFQSRHTPERSQDIFHIMQQSPFVSLAQGTEIATLQKLHCFMKHSSPSLAGHIQIQSNYDILWLYQFLVNKVWLNAYFLLHFWGFLLKGRDMLHSCGSLAKPTGTSKRKLKIEQSASPNFYWSVFYKWPWIACTFMYIMH